MSKHETAIAKAYGAVLAEAAIDQASIRLEGETLTVNISGEPCTARVKAFTVEGLKAAIAEALGDFCAIKATLRVAGGSVAGVSMVRG